LTVTTASDYFEAHFQALNEHLDEVRPIFDEFCARRGFVYVNKLALGRYPRVRIERTDERSIWFDLWMEFDKDGRRFEKYSPNLPYELGAGADLIVQDGSKYGTRFQKAFSCFTGRPFREVPRILRSTMEHHLPLLESWDAKFLLDNGLKVVLGGTGA
jgi:hypothetical protein